MDENTKLIVASNLAVAYCANRPAAPFDWQKMRSASDSEGTPRREMSEHEILTVYRSFLAQLTDSTASSGT
jgi:hypothetical protein